MIKMINLILEKFGIPVELEKQLENISYSSLGYVLNPLYIKYRKILYKNKIINDNSFESVKKVFDTIDDIIKNNKIRKKETIRIKVPDYYNINKVDTIISIKLSIESTNKDTIYIESDDTSKIPNFTIYKDSAGWNFNKFVDFKKNIIRSYKTMVESYNNKLVFIENMSQVTEKWKILDTPKKSKDVIDGQQVGLFYNKTVFDNKPYYFYVRVLSKGSQDTYTHPIHFMASDPPHILHTIYIDNFDPFTTSINLIETNIQQYVNDAKHEGRHLLQYIGNIEKGIIRYGLPKNKLSHVYNTSVRGMDSHGKDNTGVVPHQHRNIEYKTNLYDYKNDIEKVLSKNHSKNNWNKAFKDLLLFTIGKISPTQFYKEFPKSAWEMSVTYRHLKNLYNTDRDKFNNLVREIYKLIF